ncbi:DotI/IcmL/TraM family protein [Pseudomonas luteola]
MSREKKVLGTTKTAKSNSNNTGSGQAVVRARNSFYKDGSKILKTGLYGSIGCLIGSVIATFYSASQRENNVYFAATNDGKFIKLIALNEPNLSDAAVTNWLSRALIDTFDFNFLNVNQRLNETTMRWFTQDGGNELLKAIQSGGNLDSVAEKELFVNLTLDSAPLLVDRGVAANGNIFAWKYEVPGLLTYRTRTKTYSDKVIFNVTVQRQSMISSPDGLGIAKIIMLVKR